MSNLHESIAAAVRRWREAGYPVDDFDSIAEVLEFQSEAGSSQLRYLRPPQFRALETYWYLRLVAGTPRIPELYQRLFPRTSELLGALGLNHPEIREYVLDHSLEALWDRIRTDDGFVRDFKLEALRESLTLDYASYIFALAMGAGKTALIGTIIATEFALAQEYPDGPFVQNALVFAPGKTIIESLRELADIPYAQILPPRMYKRFAASLRLTFTRDGEKDVPVIRGSLFNLVVTNTEKIRIQKETIRRSDLGTLFSPASEEQARSEVANLRLQAIASLPHLGIFSDEAHHTYGQSLGTELKKVRKTVDYLAANTRLICVVNTTGTPYFQRQPLKDVVIWYGLSEGIRDNILKDLSGNIQAYDFAGDAATYVRHVVQDFFRDYGAVQLPNGALAKLALYFPQTDDLRDLRPVIDQTLVDLGLSPTLCLVNTSDESLTKPADIQAFNRLNDPAAPHRIILLVNKGTEGWNCPSLFACALARRLRTSNNFVLQAATRCLRQVPGNAVKARVYLSTENFNILDRQLQETYGESIADLNHSAHETRRERIVLRRLDLPPLVVTKTIRTVARKEAAHGSLRLKKPADTGAAGTLTTYTLADQQTTSSVLRPVGETVTVTALASAIDVYAAAADLAATYHLETWDVYDALRQVYDSADIPLVHLSGLARQIEEQFRAYEVNEERVDVALALVKKDGFEVEQAADGQVCYTAEITFPKDRADRLVAWEEMKAQNAGDFGFHYSPYNFDSRPEMYFFEQVLHALNLHPDEVENVYFTGALTDPGKTDFFVEYLDVKGKTRRYTPDFVIRKKPGPGRQAGTGKVYVVEIKAERERDDPMEGEGGRKEMALRRWQDLDPDRLWYQLIFTSTDIVPADQLDPVRRFIQEPSS